MGIKWVLSHVFNATLYASNHNCGFQVHSEIVLEDKSLPKLEVEYGPRVCPLWSKG